MVGQEKVLSLRHTLTEKTPRNTSRARSWAKLPLTPASRSRKLPGGSVSDGVLGLGDVDPYEDPYVEPYVEVVEVVVGGLGFRSPGCPQTRTYGSRHTNAKVESRLSAARSSRLEEGEEDDDLAGLQIDRHESAAKTFVANKSVAWSYLELLRVSIPCFTLY